MKPAQILATTATVFTLLSTSNVAQAFIIGGNLDGAAFDALNLDIPWAAESRIGRNGDHELNIHDSTNSNQNRVQAQYDQWVSGQAVDFSLTFNNALNTLNYTVDGVELIKTDVFEDNFSDLYIRTSARKDGTSMLVNNLSLSDAVMSLSIGSTSSASCSGGIGCGYYDADYLHIGEIVGDFTLTGQSTMTWLAGNKPNNSNLAYQIKLVEGKQSVPVPAPATFSLFILGFIGLVGFFCRPSASADAALIIA